MSGEVTFSPVEIRAVVRFCVLRGLCNQDIHSQLVEAYKANAPSHSWVTKWAGRFRSGRVELEDDPRSGRPPIEGLAQRVLDALEDQPFASTRELGKVLGFSHMSIFNTLTMELGFKKFLSHCVPHLLTEDQKTQRIQVSGVILRQLERLGDSHLTNVITIDESWFYFDYTPEAKWARRAQDVEPRPKRGIGAKKVMVTVMWSVRGFHLIEVLPDDQTFTSEYACNLLDRLDYNIRELRPKMGLRGMTIHWDNARPHAAATTKEKLRSLGVSLLPHPPYSPDLAPSDFFLFGVVKKQLEGIRVDEVDGLVAAISSITQAIKKETLCSVFDEWKRRLKVVNESDGGYFG